MKKVSICIAVLIAMLLVFKYANKEIYVEDDVHSRVISNFEDVVANPESYPDYSIEVFDSHSVYIDEIIADTNVNAEARKNLYLPPYEDEENIVYARYKDKVAVTNKYNIYPYYYIKFISENGKVCGIDSITAAAIDFADGRKVRSFSGAMLYLNESNSGIYQNIYGNFYDNGITFARQADTETLMKIEYTLDSQQYSDKAVAFSSQRGIYFQFNK